VDILVSFDIASLFTNVPVKEVLQIIRNRLSGDITFLNCSPLQVEGVMELLVIWMKTTYFQSEDTFFQ
jgi:hypothetical protein